MESNINKLRMKEILDKVGFPVTINEFRNTYKYNVNLDIAIEFENKLKQIKKISDIERIICEYEDIFDKELYVFHIARLLEQDIESIKRALLLEKDDVNQLVFTKDKAGENKRRFFVNAKNLLKNSDVIDIVMKKKSKGEFEIYLSKDFIEQNEAFSEQIEQTAEYKLQKIEEKIGLKNVLAHLKNSDLTDICRYPNLAILLIVNQEKLEKNVRKYIQYMDLDKMLVLANAVYFYKHGENFYKFSKEDVAELKKFTKSVSQIVGNNVKFLQSTRFYFTIDFNEIKEKVQKMFEVESLGVLNGTNEIAIEKTVEELAKEIIDISTQRYEEDTIDGLENIIDNENNTANDVENEETQQNIIQESSEESVGYKENENDIIEQENITKQEKVNIEEQENIDAQCGKENEEKVEHQYITRFINAENKILMNFENRKNIILNLDENYSEDNSVEGTSIFCLPNKKCYIIETTNNDFGGNATYIVDKELFERQRSIIIENQKLNQKGLSILKLKNHKSVTKLVYTGWGNSIATFFNMKTEEKYTEDEKNNINKLLNNIKI